MAQVFWHHRLPLRLVRGGQATAGDSDDQHASTPDRSQRFEDPVPVALARGGLDIAA
jgi:hypothetical protein